ncbi:PLP-dependent aminotransferase family protein [Dongia sp.]|uniref:aminotransferase-like domain-containing protein n=1 Tax=Dongia sp. TaxID=1977262 RepID=UPI00374FDE10
MDLQLKSAAAAPLQEQVVAALRAAIAAKTLLPGERLPSIRKLAAANRISPFTAVEAYDRLIAQGLITAKPKSGFFVAGREAPLTLIDRAASPGHAAPETVDPVWMMRQSLSLDDRVVHSACGWLPDSWLPEAGIRRALRGIAAMPGAQLLQYGHPLGYLPLRQQIRMRLAELDIAAAPETILLTDGASQAVDLVCRHLLQPGDAVLVDDPGYFNYHAVLRAHRARALPVPMTRDGVDLAAMERLAAAEHPKLYLANQAIQNPTGLSLAPGQAHRLLNLAQRHDFRIVEDDVFRDFQAVPTPRLAALDGFTRVLHLGGFSKTISAALRVGFIAGPAETIRHLADLKLATTFGNNQGAAQVVHRLLEDGSYRKHVAALREKLRKATPPLCRRLEALGLKLWTEAEQGMFLWMELPKHAPDAEVLAARAIGRGVVLAPGSVFSPSRQWKRFLRINIAQSIPARLTDVLAAEMKAKA